MQIHSAILYKGLEYPQIMKSSGDHGIYLPWIPGDIRVLERERERYIDK
jgi:hypothetical protein